jgi:hypothetical protein
MTTAVTGVQQASRFEMNNRFRHPIDAIDVKEIERIGLLHWNHL